ncbi:MAG: hypothetical protein WBP22_02160 [Candidatus Saccharimonas sp.]
MTPDLAGALLILVYLLIVLAIMLMVYLSRKISSLKSEQDKPFVVKVAPQEKDNNWTKWTAEAQARGVENAARITADAQVQAARIAAKTAADNLATEQARLQRVRLEQAKKLV